MTNFKKIGCVYLFIAILPLSMGAQPLLNAVQAKSLETTLSAIANKNQDLNVVYEIECNPYADAIRDNGTEAISGTQLQSNFGLIHEGILKFGNAFINDPLKLKIAERIRGLKYQSEQSSWVDSSYIVRKRIGYNGSVYYKQTIADKTTVVSALPQNILAPLYYDYFSSVKNPNGRGIASVSSLLKILLEEAKEKKVLRIEQEKNLLKVTIRFSSANGVSNECYNMWLDPEKKLAPTRIDYFMKSKEDLTEEYTPYQTILYSDYRVTQIKGEELFLPYKISGEELIFIPLAAETLKDVRRDPKLLPKSTIKKASWAIQVVKISSPDAGDSSLPLKIFKGDTLVNQITGESDKVYEDQILE